CTSFFFQAEDGIRDGHVTGVQTCALPIFTGFAWPPTIWGGGTTRLFLFPDAPVDATTIGNYVVNQIQTVTGHNGTPTQALYQQRSEERRVGKERRPRRLTYY